MIAALRLPRARPHHRMRSMMALVAMLGVCVWTAGCTQEQEAQRITCGTIVKEAAFEAEIDDQINGFDKAISECDSYEEVTKEIESNGRVVGYSVDEFVRRRCQDNEVLTTTDVCLVASPPTTLVDVAEDPEYVGTTLDGKQVTVTPDDGVEFVGDQPKVIARTVELAGNGGSVACTTVIGVRDDYALFVDPEGKNTRDQEIASMYAQHAQLVADFIGCLSNPVVIGRPDILPVPAPADDEPAEDN